MSTSLLKGLERSLSSQKFISKFRRRNRKKQKLMNLAIKFINEEFKK